MKIGFWEIIIVLIVALIVIGPDKLPEYMRSLGKGLAQMKNATSSITDDIQKEVVEPLQEVAKPLKDAVDPIADTAVKVNQKVNDINHTINDLNHPVNAAKKYVDKKAKEESVQQDENSKWICPNCGNEADGKFCNNCGSPKKTLETVEQEALPQQEDTL